MVSAPSETMKSLSQDAIVVSLQYPIDVTVISK